MEREKGEFIRECMADALLRLMRDRPVGKITIDQIARTAGVSRATWFRHFSSKEDALTYKLVLLWGHWLESHDLQGRAAFDLENAELFFAYNLEIRDILDLIYREDMRLCVYDAFCRIMTPLYPPDETGFYKACFYTYGLFGLLDTWITKGYPQTPREMGAILHREILADRKSVL